MPATKTPPYRGLTVKMPESLHQQLEKDAEETGIKRAEIIRSLLRQRYEGS